MAESDELFNEVAQMRDELEEQGAMIDALVHVGGEKLRTQILDDMEKDVALREVYLGVNGSRTQQEIVQDLDSRGIAKKSSVSLKFDRLANDYKLIQPVRRAKAGMIYKRTRLGKTLNIERALEKIAASKGRGPKKSEAPKASGGSA
jgi:hypothetical protein